MYSSMIGKIEKARRYAQEPERVAFTSFSVNFRGENDSHTVSLDGDKWHCSCNFFAGWHTCSHVMALQRMFPQHLSRPALESPLADYVQAR